jgi:uncharacterized protein YjbI with pentapeptide repeats
MQELAWEMYTTQRLAIPFSEFPERVTKHFGLKDDPEQAAFFEQDARTQSYLIRDSAGDYRFAHKSFMEYFVAFKLVGAIDSPNFDIGKAVEIWSARSLSLEIRRFVADMIQYQERLWRLIKFTREKRFKDVEYLGGNAATILCDIGESFSHRDLEASVLVHADFRGQDLTGCNFHRALLNDSFFDGANLTNAKMTRAWLIGSAFREACVVGTSFRGSDLYGADFRETDTTQADFSGASLEAVTSTYPIEVRKNNRADFFDQRG